MLASFGLLHLAESNFEACLDVHFGGVMAAVPALLENGLHHNLTEHFQEFNGYYSMTHVLTLLAFMSMCGLKTVERLRHQPPGELGKLIGLDRVPEVRCLRAKLTELAADGAAESWSEALSSKWLSDTPDLAGVLYVDGHVRLYGGEQPLPKQYASRLRLCMRGVMDFWVNDMLGQPFFVVRQEVNHGMLAALRTEIVPRLLREVPGQPSEADLAADPQLHRFILVFDREGYSPEFFREMWDDHRIGCITYRKYADTPWDEGEFHDADVELVNGEPVAMRLAERDSTVGSDKKKCAVKEVRKLTPSGRQTSIICTAKKLEMTLVAVLMFARWSQENFFSYMMRHYGIDCLTTYLTIPVSETEYIVSPHWKELERKLKSCNGKISSKTKAFGALTLRPQEEDDEDKYLKWIKRKSSLAEDIEQLEQEKQRLLEERSKTNQYIDLADLPEEQQFENISSSKKHLVDTVKMIAYRAETSMASLMADKCVNFAEARAIVRSVCVSDADLLPDANTKTLTVRIHNLPTATANRKLDVLLETLNEAKSIFPGTDMTMRFERLGERDPIKCQD